MPATMLVNNLTVVHRDSGGTVMSFPDVCKTPGPGGVLPVPYPNIAQSTSTVQGSATVSADGNPLMLKSSSFLVSTGDEAGTALGVMSNRIKGKAYPKLYSFDVKIEGENVFRLGDLMLCNGGSPTNTPPAAEMQPPLSVMRAGPPLDPVIPEVTKLAWSRTDVCCGDEVEMQVQVKNLDASMSLPVITALDSNPTRGREHIAVPLDGSAGTQSYVVYRGGVFRRDVKLLGSQSLFAGVEKTAAPLIVKTVPDAQELKKFERRAPAYKQKDAAGNMKPAGYDYIWEVCYEAEIRDGQFAIARKVDFDLREGATATAAQRSAWRREVESVWHNRFKVHRTGCMRGTDCCCSGHAGCCAFAIQIRCRWGAGHGKKVELFKGANGQKWGDPRWWYSHTWWEEIAPETVSAFVRAHEFGHLIGMYDEYPEGACHPDRVHCDESESIMGGGVAVSERHFEEFFAWFRAKAEPVLGDLTLVRMAS